MKRTELKKHVASGGYMPNTKQKRQTRENNCNNNSYKNNYKNKEIKWKNKTTIEKWKDEIVIIISIIKKLTRKTLDYVGDSSLSTV